MVLGVRGPEYTYNHIWTESYWHHPQETSDTSLNSLELNHFMTPNISWFLVLPTHSPLLPCVNPCVGRAIKLKWVPPINYLLSTEGGFLLSHCLVRGKTLGPFIHLVSFLASCKMHNHGLRCLRHACQSTSTRWVQYWQPCCPTVVWHLICPNPHLQRTLLPPSKFFCV